MSFKSLKQNSKSSFDSLAKKIQENNSKGYSDGDDRFLKVERDKGGNASIQLRFLPPTDGEDTPFIKYYTHGFKGPTGLWYIENSLTSLGKDDALGQYNSKLWNSVDSDETPERKQVRATKRRLHYVSNVYVIKSHNDPSVDGTVRLYKYGAKIFDKINDKMFPTYDDEASFNPFDFWGGANFRLRVSTIQEGNNKYPNYDKSTFDNPSALFDDDDMLESIWKQQFKLQEFLAPSAYKSYDELRDKVIKVLGLTEAEFEAGVLPGKLKPRGRIVDDIDDTPVERPARKPKSAPPKEEPSVSDDGDDDDFLASFKRMADD